MRVVRLAYPDKSDFEVCHDEIKKQMCRFEAIVSVPIIERDASEQSIRKDESNEQRV